MYACMYVFTSICFQDHLHYGLYREKNINIRSQSKWHYTSVPDVTVVFLQVLDPRELDTSITIQSKWGHMSPPERCPR